MNARQWKTISGTYLRQFIPLIADVLNVGNPNASLASPQHCMHYKLSYMIICVEHLETYITGGYFDGKHEHCLPFLGFYLGMVHGGVLTDRGQLRPDVTTLVVLQQRQTTRGYRAGREWYFYEASPRERWQTERDLIARLRELAREHLHFRDRQATLRYAFGCILGELSGHLFPKTAQEAQAWEAAWQQVRQAYAQEQAQREQYHPEQVGHA